MPPRRRSSSSSTSTIRPPAYRNTRRRILSTPSRSPGVRVNGNISSPGRFARNVGTALFNHYAPFSLRAAVGAGRLAYGAYQAFRRRQRRRPVVRGQKYHTTGKYGGKFSKKFKPVQNSVVRQKGFVHTAEIHGIVSDPDCAYVGQSCYSGYQIVELICQCLLKKLFAKANFVCQSITQNLPAFSDDNVSNLWRIRFARINREDGTVDNQDFTTVANTSINLIVGDKSAGVAPQWPGFVNSMLAYMTGDYGSGTSALNVQEPYMMFLYREEGNVGVFYQHEAVLHLGMEEFHIFSKSELKVQNRTLAADNSNDATDVSNNPLIGYEYRFSSGSPRSKHGTNSNLLSSVSEPSGLITARAAQLEAAMKEPPSPTSWWNCVASSKVRLEPGEIKKSVIYHKSSMNLLKFMKKCNFSVGHNLKQVSLFGKSSLLALEDIINVNPTNNISLAYEINREFGGYLTTKFKLSSFGNRYDMQVNNVPA